MTSAHFRAAACQAHSPVKTLYHIRISRRGSYWRFEFEANAFLHHMIRNAWVAWYVLAGGSLVHRGLSKVLQACDRTVAAPPSRPMACCFLGPVYAADWGLPQRSAAYDWLP